MQTDIGETQDCVWDVAMRWRDELSVGMMRSSFEWCGEDESFIGLEGE